MPSITQYDQPAKSEFINTFSPVPFNELMQAGMMKAKQYESGLEGLMQSYEDTNNLKYIPNSKDEQYIKGVVVPHARQIVDKYANEDLSDPIIRRQMRMELNSGIDRQRIKSIQDSFEGYKQYVGEKMKLQQTGKLSPLEGQPHQNWDTSVQGTFQQLPSEWSDPIKGLQDKYFQGLEGQIVRDHSGVPIADPRGYYTSAITANRIGQETEANLNNALSTPDGQRAVALYRHQFNIPDTVSDRDVLRQAMLSVGHKYIQDKIVGDQYSEWMTKDKEDKNPFEGIGRIQGINVKNTGIKPTDFDKTKVHLKAVSPSGEYKLNVTGMSPSLAYGLKRVEGYDMSMLNNTEVKDLIKLLPDNYKKDYDILVNHSPLEKDTKEYKDAYNTIQDRLFSKLKDVYSNIDEHLNKSSYSNRLKPKQATEATESLFGTGEYLNRKFLSLSGEGVMTGTDWHNKEYVQGLKDNPTAKPHVIGLVHPDNVFSHPSVGNDPEFRKGIEVSYNGKTYIMSGNPSSFIDKNANDTYQQMSVMRGTELQEPNFPGVTEIYTKETKDSPALFKFKDNGVTISSDIEFDNAYNQMLEYLRKKYNK